VTPTPSPSPVPADAVLDERARQLARPVDAARSDAAEGPWSVTFGVAGTRCALSTAHVLEVIRLATPAPLPGAPPAMVGVATLRGAVLPVADLGSLLGTSPVAAVAGALALVVGEAGPEVILAVNDVLDVGPEPASPLSPLPPAGPLAPTAVCRGVRADGVIVLDGAALLADPRLSPGAARAAEGPATFDRRNA
jgi:purine-binding chemotaxis protein CheW